MFFAGCQGRLPIRFEGEAEKKIQSNNIDKEEVFGGNVSRPEAGKKWKIISFSDCRYTWTFDWVGYLLRTNLNVSSFASIYINILIPRCKCFLDDGILVIATVQS